MKLLIIDDENSLVTTLAVGLKARWQEAAIFTANDGTAGLQLFHEVAPDLVVLDVTMPGMTGFEFLEEVRRTSDTPVLMLTAHDDDWSKVHGLELGADDYLTKPFKHRELSARVKVLLRRAGNPAPDDQLPLFRYGDLEVNLTTHEVTLCDERIKLTPTEYRLLHELVSNAGRVLSFADLLLRVWGAGYENDLNSLKIYVSRLRKKLHDDPHQARYVLTERNVGYQFPAPGVPAR